MASSARAPSVQDPGPKRSGDTEEEAENRLAPFNPTSDQVQESLQQILDLRSDDVLFDLGCGDGRFLVNAAKKVPGLRCVGIEYDAKFFQRATESISELSPDLKNRIEIRHQDLLAIANENPLAKPAVARDDTSSGLCSSLSLKDASVIYLFLLPKGIKKIKRLLDRIVSDRLARRQELRVVTYLFQIHGWEPTLVDCNTKSKSPIYFYRFKPT